MSALPFAHVRRHARRLIRRWTGRVALETAVLVLTHACDSRCPSCACRVAAPDEISADAWVRLARDAVARGATGLLVTGGEPLQHPAIGTLLPAFAGTGARVSLHTNALSLARHAPLVGRTCNTVYVSIDGWDRQSYRRARGVDGWDAARAGVAALRRVAPELPVRARVLLTRFLVGNVAAQCAALLDAGCASVSFLAVDAEHSDAFGRAGRPGAAGLRPPASAREPLAAELREAERRFPGRLVDSPTAITRALALSSDLSPGPPRCSAPWTTVVVEPDGRLRPCFFLPPEATGRGGLAELDGPAFRALRRRLDLTRRAECRRCVCWKS